jgi:hypothetical protein
MTTSVLCIVIFRFKGSVNKNKNSISCYFAVISLALSILIFLISLVAESLIQTHFKYIDYPCKDKPIQSDQNTIVFRFLSLEVITDEQRNEFCKDKTYDYYASICTKLEYTMSYLTSTIIEFCSIILCFFWYNDFRRIREKVDGELPMYDTTYLSKEQMKNVLNYREGYQVDPSDRYLRGDPSQSIQSNIVFVNNKNKISKKQNGVNKNNSNNENNFIKNLRREMQQDIESIDEESSENKDNKNDTKELKNSEDFLSVDKNSNNSNNNNNNNEENDEKKVKNYFNFTNEDNEEKNEGDENNNVNVGENKNENNENIENNDGNVSKDENNENIENNENDKNNISKDENNENIIIVDEENKDKDKSNDEKIENNDDNLI